LALSKAFVVCENPAKLINQKTRNFFIILI
jgi:hypothetical protein